VAWDVGEAAEVDGEIDADGGHGLVAGLKNARTGEIGFLAALGMTISF
jgi:hypothetical protein